MHRNEPPSSTYWSRTKLSMAELVVVEMRKVVVLRFQIMRGTT
jgi:hypothetical protein